MAHSPRPSIRNPQNSEADVPVLCERRSQLGTLACTQSCPLEQPPDVFHYVRVTRPEELPPADDRIVDVSILDMNHSWPNLGHDSLVRIVRGVGCDLHEAMCEAGLTLRVLSFDVRGGTVLPAKPSERFSLFLGTGGPGHLDPRENNGVAEWSQGVVDRDHWERPLFALFDAVMADEQAVLLAVCHTYGLLCRWSGAAVPKLRGPEKGGKSSGVLENVLSDEALAHPWFSRFAEAIPDGRRLRILDSRLFDLIPTGSLPAGATALGYETNGAPGKPGEAVTMIEFARDRAGVMPRVLGVNHHPEILQRDSLLKLLEQKFRRGDVTAEWYDERVKILTTQHAGEDSERLVMLTSHYTLVAPLRFHLTRIFRRRAEALGRALGLHEDATLTAR